MIKTITFNELRKIKENLPKGSSQRMAEELGLSYDTVRNYFGGEHFTGGSGAGYHVQPGPEGGLVILDDTVILDLAMDIIKRSKS